ncbi:uncharacterized protein METZ01_LOCUS339016 [marine metagenome]|uniref:Flagellar assembly protein T C-terminal domain-containing protein n=1 Tax=marine metagenome TaxID=408172 RepID=A0A382QN43_9ZZZZ
MKSLNLLIAHLLVLFNFSYAAADTELPVVAVSEFIATIDKDKRYFEKTSKAENFAAMVETQLVKIGRFTLLERNQLDKILTEQGIQQSITNGAALRVDGADYLVYGAITEYSEEARAINTGNFQSTKLITTFGIDVKIADAHTGEIRRAEAVKISHESGSAINTGRFKQADISSNGLVSAQRKAAKQVGALLVESIFPISVVDTFDGDIYLNYGNSILSIGDTLKISRQGRRLVDPQSGKVLGSTQKEVAKIRVKETENDFSIAELIEGEMPSAGDLAKVESSQESKYQTERPRFGKKI